MNSSCRHCHADLDVTFCDLGMSPVANSFVRPEQVNAMEPFYPLHAYVCRSCKLVQLQEFETPQEIFSDYAYFSSFSDHWVAHAQRYVHDVIERFDISSESCVIEIASNDGYLLQFFKAQGIQCLGVEPAENVAKVAWTKHGINSLVEFFGLAVARKLARDDNQADLLIANNVLAHVPDLNDFVAGLKAALKPNGVATLEFPHLLQLMNFNQFDTIYHEHFSYFSLMTVEAVFSSAGLTVIDVEELETHGGSLRVFATHDENSTQKTSPRVKRLRDIEAAAGLGSIEAYKDFSDAAKATKRSLLKFLLEARAENKAIVGYGAPAKGVTLLNYCGIGTDIVDYTVDRNPEKQGRLMPGVRLPIYALEKLKETKPDFVLILPWNLKDEIIEQHSYIRQWGGQFVIPIPQTVVVT